jgi:hypothetical protein
MRWSAACRGGRDASAAGAGAEAEAEAGMKEDGLCAGRSRVSGKRAGTSASILMDAMTILARVMPLLGPRNRGCFEGSTMASLTLLTKSWTWSEFSMDALGLSVGVDVPVRS